MGGKLLRLGIVLAMLAPTALAATAGPAASAGTLAVTEYPLAPPPQQATGLGRGPDSITAGPDGNLWFTETDADSIGVMTTGGVVTHEYAIPTPPAHAAWPQDITAGPDGALWFTMIGDCSEVPNPTYPGSCVPAAIGRMTTGGQLTEFPIPSALVQEPTGPDPQGITVGSDGALWFGDPGTFSIGRITTTGTITEYPIPGTRPAPWSLTAGPDGNVWFVDGSDTANQIGKITPSGQISQYPLPDQTTNYPTAITSGPDGALWFAAQGVVGRITTSASLANTTVTEFPVPHCACGDITSSSGTLWFTTSTATDPTTGQDWDVVASMTTAGVVTEYRTPTSGATPAGIARGPDGNLWFAESGANQIGFLGAPVPPPQLSISDASVQEPALVQALMTFTVTMSRPAVGASVYATTAPGTASDPEDYSYQRVQLTFPFNSTTATFSVPVKADQGGRTEYFYVNLSSPANAVVAGGQGVGTILEH